MKLKSLSVMTLIVGAGIFLLQCEKHSPKLTAEVKVSAPSGALAAAKANNEFALNLYSQLSAADGNGNLFFSPYSISVALAMTYEGSRGKTAQEMQSVLRFPSDDKTRREAFLAMNNKINKKTADYKLHAANALWVQKDFKILSAYTGTIEKFYGGRSANVDFVNATAEARVTINEWVEGKTNYKIKNLFPQGTLNPLTRLVLTNAVYFKGDWLSQFDAKETKKEDFKVGEGKTVKIPMMKQTGKEAKFGYTETDSLQILEMPYKGEDLSMLVLLPKEDDLTALEAEFSLEKLAEWKSKLRNQRVDVHFPKFKTETKYNLNKTLSEMGMPAAFSESAADFSGITGAKALFIGLVVHQAYVDVNEEGTEAAAATGVSMQLTSAPPLVPVFRADRPFIFLIQDKETGNILFMGKIADPSK